MQGKDSTLHIVQESVKRRYTRIALVSSGIIGVCMVLSYLDIAEPRTSLFCGFIIIYMFWRSFGHHYQFVLSPYHFYTTMGSGNYLISWADVTGFKVDPKGLVVSCDGRPPVIIDLTPFDPVDKSAAILYFRYLFEIAQEEGLVEVPASNSVKMETDRLDIRPVKSADVRACNEIRYEPSNIQYQLHDPLPQGLDGALLDFDIVRQSVNPLCWTLVLTRKSDPEEIIGVVHVNMDQHFFERDAALGFSMAERHRGRGYMTEAVEAVLVFVEENTNIVKITAECFTVNLACARVLEKAGMRKVGKLERSWFRRGKWMDSYRFEKVFKRSSDEVIEQQPEPEVDDNEDQIMLG